MRKRDEITRPDTCMGRALDHEVTFVLLARDADAPGAVRDWIARRVASGKGKPGDPDLVEAEACARAMEEQRDAIRAELGKPTRPANRPAEIGLKNLKPGDRVSACRPSDNAWVEIELVSRIDVPLLVDLAVGPVWNVRDEAGAEWESTGEFMEPLPWA